MRHDAQIKAMLDKTGSPSFLVPLCKAIITARETLATEFGSRRARHAANQLFDDGYALAGSPAVPDQEGRARKPGKAGTDKPSRLLVRALGLAGADEGFVVPAAVMYGRAVLLVCIG